MCNHYSRIFALYYLPQHLCIKKYCKHDVVCTLRSKNLANLSMHSLPRNALADTKPTTNCLSRVPENKLFSGVDQWFSVAFKVDIWILRIGYFTQSDSNNFSTAKLTDTTVSAFFV